MTRAKRSDEQPDVLSATRLSRMRILVQTGRQNVLRNDPSTLFLLGIFSRCSLVVTLIYSSSSMLYIALGNYFWSPNPAFIQSYPLSWWSIEYEMHLRCVFYLSLYCFLCYEYDFRSNLCSFSFIYVYKVPPACSTSFCTMYSRQFYNVAVSYEFLCFQHFSAPFSSC